MKTIFAIVGGIVVFGGGSVLFYNFWYVPNFKRIMYEKFDWLKKEITWRTNFSSGVMNFDQLKSMPDMTMGVSKGNETLEMKRLNDNVVRFTLLKNGKILDTNEIDFSKQNTPGTTATGRSGGANAAAAMQGCPPGYTQNYFGFCIKDKKSAGAQ